MPAGEILLPFTIYFSINHTLVYSKTKFFSFGTELCQTITGLCKHIVQYALPLDDAPAAPTPSARTAASLQTASAPNADALLHSLTKTQRVLFSCLSQTPRHLDALAQAANLTVIQAGVEMTLLELTGLIRRLPGNTYIRAL